MVTEERHRTFGLLGTLLILFVGLPLSRAQGLAAVAGGVLYSAVIFWGLWVLSEHRRQMIVGVVLMAPAFVLTIAYHASAPFPAVQVMWLISNGLVLALLVAILVRRLFRTQRVTADTLSTAISGYILLGILWAFLYGLLYWLNPESFRGVTDPRTPGLFYFSFVTLTTLGYGDIVPVTDAAETAAVLEAVVGQLYLAITIARLVGLHIASARAE